MRFPVFFHRAIFYRAAAALPLLVVAALPAAGREPWQEPPALWGLALPDATSPAGWLARLYLGVVRAEGPLACTLRLGLAWAAGPVYQYEQSLARADRIGLWR